MLLKKEKKRFTINLRSSCGGTKHAVKARARKISERTFLGGGNYFFSAAAAGAHGYIGTEARGKRIQHINTTGG